MFKDRERQRFLFLIYITYLIYPTCKFCWFSYFISYFTLQSRSIILYYKSLITIYFITMYNFHLQLNLVFSKLIIN